jgi:DNA modification methylase
MFGGAGTTGLVAERLGRNAVLIEVNPRYALLARRRTDADHAQGISVRRGCSLDVGNSTLDTRIF